MVKDGAFSLKEFKDQLIYYALNDVETENIYFAKRKFLREYAAEMLYARHVVSKKAYDQLMSTINNPYGLSGLVMQT